MTAIPSYSDTVAHLRAAPAAHSTSRAWPVFMLFARTGLFLLAQAVIAIILAARGTPDAFRASAGWWPVAVTAASLACLALLVWLLRREGRSYASLWRIDRAHLGSDLLAMLGFTILAGPISYAPNILLANLFFGSSEAAFDLFFRPLPLRAGLMALVGFPVSVALSELPTYFGYAMPRIEAATGRRWLPYLAAALMLSAQHIALPLILDGGSSYGGC